MPVHRGIRTPPPTGRGRIGIPVARSCRITPQKRTDNMKAFWVSGALCVFIASAAFGQGVSQISGTVKDQVGAVLPGVEITATQTETRIARTTVSNETGNYVLPNLPVGPYK